MTTTNHPVIPEEIIIQINEDAVGRFPYVTRPGKKEDIDFANGQREGYRTGAKAQYLKSQSVIEDQAKRIKELEGLIEKMWFNGINTGYDPLFDVETKEEFYKKFKQEHNL